ncbi:Legumain [Tritrichomonas foetus]|uniref:Legumain n=1 Tax=Tritrichomonas foetus TaxID=1144522 RepID=A0A1J4JRP9_9EUKA|nr:Legumain [Tritrichomonas foetus]|eukprot:OHT01112.1 Legumain [Tritrichomonas foetus]
MELKSLIPIYIISVNSILKMLFFALISHCFSDTWAVIFCGSNSYYNYRHTADVYNQYQLLIKGGINQSHIILMSYDDIVNSPENIYKGHIYRALDHGVDVYPGVENIDYIGNKVTAQNFFNVLTGNTTNGPALHSTAKDDVFVFYENHGGDQVLGVPDGCGDYIMANDLLQTLNVMHTKGMYKNLFFIISSCYAGSIAEVIQNIPNIYFQTSTGDEESSYAALYDQDLGVYLTEEYPLAKDNFIEISDSSATIGDLFEYCSKNVPSSTVSEYGDLTLKNLPLYNFFGVHDKSDRINPKAHQKVEIKSSSTKAIKTEIELSTKENKINNLRKSRMMVSYVAEQISEFRLNQIMNGLKNKFSITENLNKPCKNLNSKAYKKVLQALQKSLNRLGESFYEYSFFFSNLASSYETSDIVEEIYKL